jgi:hypothetical protein
MLFQYLLCYLYIPVTSSCKVKVRRGVASVAFVVVVIVGGGGNGI